MRKKKKLTLKRILKIIAGVIIFFTLPTLLLFGFLYYKYNEELLVGIESPEADVLANKMLNALHYDAYKATDYIEFTFKKRHHFKWNKTENTCEVYWKNYKVNLDLNDNSKSVAFQNEIKIKGKENQELTQKALAYFNNDTFWLVAPYKVFDQGTKRSIVTLDNNEKALLITYTSGGSTPGDSYLWRFDKEGKPKSFKMWTSILPIDGLETSWSDWTTTETGAMLPTFHKLLVLGLEIEGIKTEYSENKKAKNTITAQFLKQALKIEKFSQYFRSELSKKDTLEVFANNLDNYPISFIEKSFNNKPIKFSFKKVEFNVNGIKENDEEAIVFLGSELNDSLKILRFLHTKLNWTHTFKYDTNNKLIGIEEGQF